MWGLLIGLVQNGYSAYQKKKAHDASVEAARYNAMVNKTLGAEQIAITYNSIMKKGLEVGTQARRAEVALEIEARQAAGKLAAQAAAQGVTGRRADLVREQAVGVAKREKEGQLRNDTRREIDALIMRSEMEATATVNRLITNMPDVPQGSGFDPMGLAGDLYDEYSNWKGKQKEIDDAIVSGAQDTIQAPVVATPISSTGTNAYGVQAKL
jgi:hypothetical protein